MLVTLMAVFTLGVAATDKAEVEKVVQEFAQGAAERNEALLKSVLHEGSRQFIPTPDGVRLLDRDVYLGMIREGKIGGSPLSVTLHDVRVSGDSAAVEATFAGEGMRLDHTLSLVKGPDGWAIVSSVVRLQTAS